MPSQLPAIAYRPQPRVRELISECVKSKGYRNPGHVLSDAVLRVHGPPVVEPVQHGGQNRGTRKGGRA